MSLCVGERLGPYEILAPLGKGGMGEVWKARDTRLGRDVAIKISAEQFSERFEREARAVAALNHPNICTLFDVGPNYLVMEYIEGATLADRIKESPIPLDEALSIARHVADALDAAHEKNIIHRDLKPGNIKIKPDGMVKVLDFGLAKMGGTPTAVKAEDSPTLTLAATQAGMILGTAAYMSPEQARGKEVDKRADIWAFGVVLYEMVTGRRLFQMDDVADTLAAVLRHEPDWEAVPTQLRRLLRKCLEKDPKERLRDIGDVWELLDKPPAQEDTSRRSKLPWFIAAGLLIALLGLSFAHFRETPAVAPRMHFSIALPENTIANFFALSPDGEKIVVTMPGTGIGVRYLDSSEIRPLTGTAMARNPFWSPDSHTIGYFADGKLKIVPASGGPSQTLCNDTGLGNGGTWSRSGVIVFATEARILYRVAATGGTCSPLGKPQPGQLHHTPVFLPDGEHFLYSLLAPDEARTGLYIASLSDPNGQRLMRDYSSAVFAPDALGSTHGHLLFLREQRLMEQPFDARSLKLSGDPVVLAEQVSFTSSPPQVAASASDNGTIVYLSNAYPDRQLVWYDRSGKEIGRAAHTGFDGGAVSLAPDGKRVAFVRPDAQHSNGLWLQDLERNTETPVTTPSLKAGFPSAIWSPDSQRIAFYGSGEGEYAIYVQGAAGGKPEIVLRGNSAGRPSDWSRDGRWLIYTDMDPKTRGDIWVLPDPLNPSAARKPVPLLQTPFIESQGQLSPDGKWLAYTSNESGADQVYLRPFAGAAPLPDTKWQVSTGPPGSRTALASGRERALLPGNGRGISAL